MCCLCFLLGFVHCRNGFVDLAKQYFVGIHLLAPV
jgi:hypothetical protein